MAPSPIPVPQSWPSLRSLKLRDARPYDPQFWNLVASRAPNLTSLVVHPVFHIPNYTVVLDSCARLVNSLDALPGLDTLEIRGTGIALSLTPCTCTGRMSFVRHLTITGRQFYPHVDAPLDTAVLEEPEVAHVGIVEGLGLSAHGMSQLAWSVPVATWLSAAPTLSRFAALTRLNVAIRTIRCPDSLALALDMLGRVPSSVTHLEISLEFERMSGDDPVLDFDVAPLEHLVNLQDLCVRLTCPTRGCGPLVSHLLGVPSSASQHLRRARLHAQEGPADRLKRVRDAAYEEDEADPEDSGMIELEEEIYAIEERAVVPTDFVLEALTRFPHTHFVMEGFRLDDTCRHARLSHVPHPH
jgi:hypothetical protein